MIPLTVKWSNMMHVAVNHRSSSHQITQVSCAQGNLWIDAVQVWRPEAHHPFSLCNSLHINIASIVSLFGILGEENEAAPAEHSVILDEWGVIQEISNAEMVDVMLGAEAASEGRPSQPQLTCICKALQKSLSLAPPPCRKVFKLSCRDDLMYHCIYFCISI